MAFLEDEEKQTLLDRYCDIEWSDDVSDLRCVLCHRVAIDHYVSSCQHLFCQTCSELYKDEDQQLKCPQCQERITQPDKKDFGVEVKIHQLKIFCPNKKFGCHFADQLRKIPLHLQTCVDTREVVVPAYSPVINNMDDVNKIIEIAVKEKFNQLDCRVSVLTERMDGVDKAVEDTNVGIELKAKNYAKEFQSIKSLLESINETIKNNESHHQTKMDEMSSKVENMTKKMASMTQELEALRDRQSEVINTQKSETYEWTITDVMKHFQTDNWTIESDVFTFKGYNYNIKAKLEKKEGLIGIYLQFKDGTTVNGNLNNNGFTKCKYTIRDQSDAQNRKDITYEFDLSFYDCFSHRNWVFGHEVPSFVASPPFTNRNCIKIKISLEPPRIDRSFISNKGILMWTVDNYKTRKEEQLYAAIWSPSFYTCLKGYRMKTRLLISYKGPMLVEVCFLTGEHDKSLSINFPHKTTVTLFHQTDPSKNVVKSKQLSNAMLYTVQLECSELIEKNGFIKDDSLLLKVVIEPI